MTYHMGRGEVGTLGGSQWSQGWSPLSLGEGRFISDVPTMNVDFPDFLLKLQFDLSNCGITPVH